MKLNTDKIKKKLDKLDRTPAWLAKQCKVDRQVVYYWLSTASIRGAVPIGKVLGINPKNLIIG